MLCGIFQSVIKIANQGKPPKNIKTWSEIVNKAKGKTQEDNRSAEEIEKDVLDKFKNWTR